MSATNPYQKAQKLCHDPEFQDFVGMRLGLKDKRPNASNCANFIRDACAIGDLKNLDTNKDAQEKLNRITDQCDTWQKTTAKG